MFDFVWGFNGEKPFLQSHLFQEKLTKETFFSAFDDNFTSVGFKPDANIFRLKSLMTIHFYFSCREAAHKDALFFFYFKHSKCIVDFTWCIINTGSALIL